MGNDERPLLISRMTGACKNQRSQQADAVPSAAFIARLAKRAGSCTRRGPGSCRGAHLTPLVGVVTVSPVLRPPRDLCKRALATSAVVCTLAALIAGGCGPIEYLNQVSSKAATALAEAKRAQADRYAPYEYTAAEEYLHKAREEAGYAEYQDSIDFGRKAEELAHRARAIAMSRLGQSAPGEVAPVSPTPAVPARSNPVRKAKPARAPGGDDEEPRTIEPAPAKSPPNE